MSEDSGAFSFVVFVNVFARFLSTSVIYYTVFSGMFIFVLLYIVCEGLSVPEIEYIVSV